MRDMGRLILYTREDCHLCEDAVAMLSAIAPGVDLQMVDIDADPGLAERYGERVPVFRRRDNGAELDWPADAGHLLKFLSA